MIKKIYASDKRFKAVEFRKGLNIILAERTEGSGEKDTRNGAGKTTLLWYRVFLDTELGVERLPMR